MAKIVFDNAYQYDIDGFYEYVAEGKLTAFKNYNVSTQEVPEITPISSFETVKILTETGSEIPLIKTYTSIDSFIIGYVSATDSYNVTINLG